MSGSHTLKQKESLVTVAKIHGFEGFRAIFDAPENAALRAKRPSVNILRVGDVIAIPDKVEGKVTGPTGQVKTLKVHIGRGVWNLEWKNANGFCGDKVKLVGETNLADGKLKFFTHSSETPSPKLADIEVTIAGGKFSQEVKIENVQMITMGATRSPFEHVHVEATTKTATIPSNIGILTVDGMKETAEDTFTATRSWSGFTMNPKFKQKIENYVAKVHVTMDILKGWGVTYIDLTSAGITGNVAGAPAGKRWARSTTGVMQPNQYHDGTVWKALPAGFTVTAASYNCFGFYKSGSSFVSPSGASLAFPQTFADYDFNAASFVTKRNDWMTKTHDVWSDKFDIRRKNCTSDKSVRCCRYDIEVTMTFNVVTSYTQGTIILAPGALRSNAGLFFMGDTRLEMAAHEAGHHMDNPDEYLFGAVDPTLSGDGAVAGIDANSIMGQNLTTVKKRHLHAFAVMAQKLLKAKYGRDEAYVITEKA